MLKVLVRRLGLGEPGNVREWLPEARRAGEDLRAVPLKALCSQPQYLQRWKSSRLQMAQREKALTFHVDFLRPRLAPRLAPKPVQKDETVARFRWLRRSVRSGRVLPEWVHLVDWTPGSLWKELKLEL